MQNVIYGFIFSVTLLCEYRTTSNELLEEAKNRSESSVYHGGFCRVLQLTFREQQFSRLVRKKSPSTTMLRSVLDDLARYNITEWLSLC